MATAAQLETRLTNINARIDKAESAQSYSVSGRSVSRGNLDSMYKERDKIERQLAKKNSSSGTSFRTTEIGGIGGLH